MDKGQPARSPKISVLLPVFNAASYVRAAIESVLAQTFEDFELWAFDDGSTDRSLSILRELGAKDRRLCVVSRENRGYVVVLNELIARARGSYLARMDADDICHPTRFEMQVAYLDSHPDCVAVGSRVLLIDPAGMPICEFNDELSHEQLDAAHISGKFASRICHPSVMMRRDAVVQAGMYRQEYLYAEDLDLFLRLAEQNGKLCNLREPLLKYRQHHESVGHSRSFAQRDAARRAIEAARMRRGMPILSEMEHIDMGPQAYTNQHRVWGWWALSAGNVCTARKHAFLALAKAPLIIENMKLFACALRGH